MEIDTLLKYFLAFIFSTFCICSLSNSAQAQNDTSCDVITFIDGNVILGKVKEAGKRYIRYTPCHNISAVVIDTPRINVFMIRFSNNRLEIINTNPSYKEQEKAKEKAKKDTLTKRNKMLDTIRLSKKNDTLNGIEKQIIVNAGIGYFGYIDQEITKRYLTSTLDFSGKEISPVYNFIIDYGITRKFTIGLGISYQQVRDFNPNNPKSTLLMQKVYVVNGGLRMTYNIGSPELFYFGFRIGASQWRWIFFNNTNLYPTFPLQSSENLSFLTVQLLIGARRKITKYLFFHIEAGALDPYTVEGGLTFKINTQK